MLLDVVNSKILSDARFQEFSNKVIDPNIPARENLPFTFNVKDKYFYFGRSEP